MAGNPISSLIPKDPTSTPIGTELNERAKMQQSAVDALKPTGAPVASPAKHVSTSPMDKTKSQGPYGTGKGEKRIDVKDMVKPLGQMHSGGTIPQTGAYVMKKDEHVLTPENHSKLKNAMALAHDALSGPAQDAQPKKVVKEMHIRPTANGGFIAKHIHASFEHPDEEHVHPHMDALHDHMEEHWGEPNDGEEASENEKDESPGVMAAEKAVGMK
jgi:hypothetical protein